MTAPPNRKLKVFLCHSSDDKPAVRDLYQRLKSEGWIDPWLDEEKLFPGQDWDREIEIAVEESESVIVFLSKESVDKESYVQYELRSILHIAKYKPAGVIFILPLRINDCEVPRSLRMWQHIDYFPEDKKDWAYERILGSLKMRAAKLGIDVEGILAEKKSVEQEKVKEERRKKIAAEKASKEREDKEKKEIGEKTRKDNKERAEKRKQKKAEKDTLEKTRKEVEEKVRELATKKARKDKEERERQAALEKDHQEKIDCEKLEAVEKKQLSQDQESSQRGTELIDSVIKQISGEETQKIESVSLETYRRASRSVLQEKRNEEVKKFFSRMGKLPLFIGGGVAMFFLLGYIMSNIELPAKPEPMKISTTSVPAIATLVLPTATSLPTSTSVPTKTSTPTKVPATPTPILGVGSTMVSEKDGMTLVYIPFGEFLMGSEDGEDDESPRHTVSLDAYWIDQTEVTNVMYLQCVLTGACAWPDHSYSYTNQNYSGNVEFNDYPVIYVSWKDANAYCFWAGRRLPTEAEWEKAAGWNEDMQTKRLYPWGDEINDTYANYSRTVGDTTPVGIYEKGQSFYGVYDMAGNVMEWVDAWHDVYPGGDSTAYSYHGENARIVRGGSWGGHPSDLRTADRFVEYPVESTNKIGFRCAMDANKP